MRTLTIRQMAVVAGLALVSAVAEQARADFVFSTPKNLGLQINSYDREYDPAISADGLELYFQSYRAGGSGSSDLYVVRRAAVGEPWGSVQNLGPIINTAAGESGPSLSSDGLTLYFNSDRSGGMGGHDLYMTTRASRSDPWGQPVNLGPAVNGKFDEINPQISHDGLTLYFADVEGVGIVVQPGGVGNTDIWVTTRASLSEPWGAPVNLGTPVNSVWSDGAPDLSADGLLLFFNFYRGDLTYFNIHVATRRTVQAPWNSPIDLGAPVNGADWDGNAELSADGRTLYFISDRNGGSGATDLWESSIDPIVDFNGDGTIDDKEVRMVMDNWGKNTSLCDIGPTPFGDGVVDMQDLAVLASYASQELIDPTLVACWTFDEPDGIATGEALQAAAPAGGPIWRPDGVVGGAIELDGVDDHVGAEFGHDLSKGPLSLFVWVKGGGPGQTILAQKDAANWLLADATGALMTELRSGGRLGKPLTSQTIVTDGNWHRIGLVWDGMHRTLYVDDEPVAEDVQNSLQSAYGDLIIGSGKDLASGTFWRGLIDEVRIYRRVVAP